jgi:hypothetical protein
MMLERWVCCDFGVTTRKGGISGAGITGVKGISGGAFSGEVATNTQKLFGGLNSLQTISPNSIKSQIDLLFPKTSEPSFSPSIEEQ